MLKLLSHRVIADSPLDLAMTACVFVAVLVACFSLEWPCSYLKGAAWRITGPCAVFSADVVQIAFSSLRRWRWVDPARNWLDGVQTWLVCLLVNKLLRMHFMRYLLALQVVSSVRLRSDFAWYWVNSACRSRFWRVLDYVLPSRSGYPFIVCLIRTMMLNRMICFRSVCPNQVSLRANHSKSSPSARITRSSPSRKNVMSLPWCLHKHKLSFFDLEFEVLQRVHHDCHQVRRHVFESTHVVQQESTHVTLLSRTTGTDRRDARLLFLIVNLYILNFMFFVIILFSSIDVCLNEDVASSWRIVNSVCLRQSWPDLNRLTVALVDVTNVVPIWIAYATVSFVVVTLSCISFKTFTSSARDGESSLPSRSPQSWRLLSPSARCPDSRLPTCPGHALSSLACMCTKFHLFLALPLVQLHCEHWHRAQCVMVFTTWSIEPKHCLLSVHQQLTLVPFRLFREYSKFSFVTWIDDAQN